MSKTPRILVFGGSLRRESFNHKLALIAADGARAAGADVTVIALRDYPMPIFDQDLEDAGGKPEAAAKLKALFLEHDGLIIASPEYNSSITAALKNAIDWVSRADDEDEGPLAALSGKTAVICAASPSRLGGERGLVHLRSILGNIGITVLPHQVAISNAHQAFADDGGLIDEKSAVRVKNLGKFLTEHLFKILA